MAVCLDQAVKAAKAVQRMWYEEYTAKDRGDIVREYADLLREHADLWVGRPAHIHLETTADYSYPFPNLEEFLYQEAKQPSLSRQTLIKEVNKRLSGRLTP